MRNSALAVLLLTLAGCGRGIDRAELRRQAGPALVQVCTSGNKNSAPVCGEGFAISEGGLVVTAYRTIRGAVKGEVVTARGNRFGIARVISYDAAKDFAVLLAAAKGWTPLKATASLAVAEGTPALICSGVQNPVEGRIRGVETKGAFTVLSMNEPSAPGGGAPVLNSAGLVVGMTLPKDPEAGTKILPVHYIIGSISKDAKGFGLWEVAQLQQSEDKAEQEREMAAQYGTYGDHYGAMRSMAPRQWKMIESEHQMGGTADTPPSYEIHLLFVPPDVNVTDPLADPPAGIRARVALADRDRTWVHKTDQDLLPAISYQMAKDRPGFRKQEERFTQIGSVNAGFVDFVGASLRIRTFVVAGARCRVLVDMFSPPNTNQYDGVFEQFRRNFDFTECPEYKD